MSEGKWRWSKREETGHITDIVRSGKLGITAATPDYLNELEDCKRRLAMAEGKAALADEAGRIVKELRRTATRESQDVFVRKLRNEWWYAYDAIADGK
jgi:hypothetical protein